MSKYTVKNHNASAFASSEGTFQVVKGMVELPDGPLALDLLSEGVIAPVLKAVEPAPATKPADESIPGPKPPEPVKAKAPVSVKKAPGKKATKSK